MTSAIQAGDLKVTSAQLRWYERYVKRYFGEELDGRALQEDEFEVRLDVGRQAAQDGAPAAIIVRQRLDAELENATVRLDVAVNFQFEGDGDSSILTSENFVATIGFEYTLGLVRSAMVDSLRSVGLPAVLLPPMRYDEANPPDAGTA